MEPPKWLNHQARTTCSLADLTLVGCNNISCTFTRPGYDVVLLNADERLAYGIYELKDGQRRLIGQGAQVSLERRFKQLGWIK